MHTSEREGEIRVELYERSELPPPAVEQVDGVHRRLEQLADVELIADVEREEWVKRVRVGECDPSLRDTYLSFTAWANAAGARLTPFFQTRECFTPEEKDYTDWLVMPAFCLAIYEDGELSAVYPHADENGTHTVQDGVESLVAEDVDGTKTEPVLAD